MEAVSCTLGVRVLTAGTGLPVADESFAERPEAGRPLCFQRVAAAVVPRVVPAAAARVTPDMRTIVLDADVVQAAAVPAVVKGVRAIGSVSGVEVRRITSARVELWVRSRLAAAPFAAALSRDVGGTVVFSGAEVTGDLVRVKARLRETASPPPPPEAAAGESSPPGAAPGPDPGSSSAASKAPPP
jgi:hypothetical protein